jgi:type VI secretion system protein ImpL
MLSVKLTWDPPAVMAETGPWALFRLFAHAKIAPGSTANHITANFQSGDRTASFDIHTSSAANPFASTAVRDFRCPNVQ